MCTQNEINHILEALSLEVEKLFKDKLKSIIVYGSYAHGSYGDESDIDIAILVDIPKDEESKYSKDVLQIISQIDSDFNYAVFLSPIVISYPFFEEWRETLPFYRNIYNEGVRISA